MNENFGNYSGELEISNLIEESVTNAAQRRQKFIEDSLVDLTEEEAKNIEGGLSLLPPPNPTTLGLIDHKPFILGIIIKPPLPKF